MKTLIIDTSYLIYRSFFAYPKLTNSDGFPTGALYGFAKTILALIKEYKPETLIFANDRHEPTWRHEMHAEYKAGRAEVQEEMIKQIPIIVDWCEQICQNVLSVKSFEADDLIFSASIQSLTSLQNLTREQVVQKNSQSNKEDLFNDENDTKSPFTITLSELNKASQKPESEVLIFSSDRDLYQLLVLPGISFIQTNNKNMYQLFTATDFTQKYELNPLQWLDYKSLVGDASDNLAGVPGIGPKSAVSVLQKFGSLYNIFASLNIDNRQFLGTATNSKTLENDLEIDSKTQKILDKIKENQDSVHSTYQLSMLQLVANINLVKGFDLAKGVEKLEKYGCKSLIPIIQTLSNIEPEGLF